jgi:hypothetical protein
MNIILFLIHFEGLLEVQQISISSFDKFYFDDIMKLITMC